MSTESRARLKRMQRHLNALIEQIMLENETLTEQRNRYKSMAANMDAHKLAERNHFLEQELSARTHALNAIAKQHGSPERDWCTDPDNCQRCQAPTWDQINKHHAGIPIGPQRGGQR